VTISPNMFCALWRRAAARIARRGRGF